MNVRPTMLFPALVLAAAACSGTDAPNSGSALTAPTSAALRYAPVSAVTVSPATATVAIGASVKLSTVVLDKQGHTFSGSMALYTEWTSSDTSVAKVSSAGVVTGVRNGKVTVTARAADHSGASAVTVGTGEVPATTTTQPITGSATTSTSTTSTPTTSTSATTTTSTTTTSTPVVPPASGSGLSGKAFIADDYSTYSSTAAFLQQVSSNIGGTGDWRTAPYNDGRFANMAEIDPTVQYNGHATLKYNQPGGVSATPELWRSFPNGQTVSTMWFRAKIRFSPGYTTTGTLTNSSNAYKLFGWQLAGVNGSGRLEITNTTQYDLYWNATDNTGTTIVPNTDAGGGPNVTNEWQSGGWYDYIIEYTLTSSTTSVARTWIAPDGQRPVLVMTRNRTAAAGYTMPRASGINLGMNFNQVRAANQSQALWYGQWEIVDGAAHPDPFGVNGGSN